MKTVIIKKLTIITLIIIASISQANSQNSLDISTKNTNRLSYIDIFNYAQQTPNNLSFSYLIESPILTSSKDPKDEQRRCSPYPSCIFDREDSKVFTNT